MKKKLSLKKLTIANLTNAELDQLHGGNSFTDLERSDCTAAHARGLKKNADGTRENSCESGIFNCH